MQKEIADKAIRSNAFKEGGIFIGNSILTDSRLTPLEKLLYGHINVLNSYGHGCYQSCEYIAAKIGGNAGSIKRCIYKLVKLGLLKRVEKGENGIRRHLVTCSFVSDETIQNYKLDQNDPAEYQIETPRAQIVPNLGRKLSQKGAQIVPDRILLKEHIEYNTNTAAFAADQNDPNPNSEEKIPSNETDLVTTGLKNPSQKVPRKKVPLITAGDPEVIGANEMLGDPRPDPSDRSLKVRMPNRDWDKFISQVGEECAFYWCQQLEDYADSQPKKFAAYKSHYKTLLKWHQMRCADGLVFGWTPQGGNGFYKHWVNGLKVGGKNG